MKYLGVNLIKHEQANVGMLAPGAASSGWHGRAALPTNLQRKVRLNPEGDRARA